MMLLVTGANGQLGTALRRVMPDAVFADSAMLDITDKDAVLRFAEQHRIDTIVNCAAYTAVDKAEDEPELAHRVNVEAVKNLAATGAKLIHISTDYVFDGMNYRPYVEDDKANPQSVYARSKYEGEQAALEHADTAIVLRTSWLYSAHGNNFLKTMMHLGKEKQSLNVVYDQIGTPTLADDLAAAIAVIVPKMTQGQKEIYHYSNEGVCSWYDFAIEIMQQAGLPCQVHPIESKDYPTKVVRPHYSVFNKSKIKRDFDLQIPHWKESLIQCLKQFS